MIVDAYSTADVHRGEHATDQRLVARQMRVPQARQHFVVAAAGPIDVGGERLLRAELTTSAGALDGYLSRLSLIVLFGFWIFRRGILMSLHDTKTSPGGRVLTGYPQIVP
jgi:hypothetical protein